MDFLIPALLVINAFVSILNIFVIVHIMRIWHLEKKQPMSSSFDEHLLDAEGEQILNFLAQQESRVKKRGP